VLNGKLKALRESMKSLIVVLRKKKSSYEDT